MASCVTRTPWCSSYAGRRPSRISIVSATDGSSQTTRWKRRSRAASFSMKRVYSSVVVAPMTCSSPRAKAGFNMFAASMEESGPAVPAPTIWCNSSMNKQMSSSLLLTSSITDFTRSSNSPRYLVPATRDPKSNEKTRFPRSRGGTRPSATLCAKPSATAVLPTPAGPTRHALFFLFRSSISITRPISASRPTTGSKSPSTAICVRSAATSFNLSFFPPSSPPPPTGASCFPEPLPVPPLAPAPTPSISVRTASRSRSPPVPSSNNRRAAPLPTSGSRPRANSRCSQPISELGGVSSLAISKSRLAFSLKGNDLLPPPAVLRAPCASKERLTARRVTPSLTNTAFAVRLPPFCSSARTPRRTNSVLTMPEFILIASSWAL
mmetsp:Transcript_25361/g.70541  ORF Transcript_25361/g.70541 Transcript_25361/m.70541 type:complete len:380 (+) Transcript_25361:1544-2683(+)